MRKNQVLIIDHDLQTCKDIRYNVGSVTTEAYYTLTACEGLAELTCKEYDLVIRQGILCLLFLYLPWPVLWGNISDPRKLLKQRIYCSVATVLGAGVR